MFWKKRKKFIVDDFSFLKDYGFSMKKYSRAPDVEYVYVRNDLEIELAYYLGVLESYEQAMCFCVIISNINGRKNLLQCAEEFGADLINKLIADIKDLDADAQVPIYAQFLKDNIDVLLNYTY
ncbi:MAG: hypothetical protein K2F90_03885 [Clostridiales bacterium]|nr:hypothetical protein [Clostridiales bacterium]